MRACVALNFPHSYMRRYLTAALCLLYRYAVSNEFTHNIFVVVQPLILRRSIPHIVPTLIRISCCHLHIYVHYNVYTYLVLCPVVPKSSG